MIFIKTYKITAGILGGIVLIFGLLWYFQEQGFLKAFPTMEDRRVKKMLVIDEGKFQPAVGLSDEIYRQKIKELYDLRGQVQKNTKDSKAWFDFGYLKEFLNDHEGAVAAWEEAYRLQPLNFLVTYNLGNSYHYFLKDFGRAEFYYQKTLEIQPAYTAAYQGLADLYRFNQKDKQDQLEPLMLAALQTDPLNQAVYYSILVEFFAGQDDLIRARDYLGRLQSVKPEEAKKLLDNYPKLK